MSISNMGPKWTQRIEDALCEQTATRLAIGYMRYERLRKLGPHQHAKLHDRCIKGERFDSLVDGLIEADTCDVENVPTQEKRS